MKPKTTQKIYRILALAAAVVLAGLYIATLVLAVTGNENTMNMLTASLFASIAVPVFLYVFRMAVRLFRKDGPES